MKPYSKYTSAAAIAALVLTLGTACASSTPPGSSHPETQAEESMPRVDWGQPMDVCQSLDESSIMSLLPTSSDGSGLEIETYDDLEFDFAPEDTVSTVGCTFSTGPGPARISVELLEKDSPQAGTELMISQKNSECVRIDEVAFLHCDDNQHWLTSTQQLGPMNVTIKGFSFGDTPDGVDVYREKMIDLHRAIRNILTNSGKVKEADITSDGKEPAESFSLEDACAFSYEEVKEAFAFDDFTTSSTTDESEWITAFGNEKLEARCRYERDGEYSSNNRVLSVQAAIRPYRDDTEDFYLDRVSGFAEACQMLKDSSDEVFGREVTCTTGEEADIVVAGLMAVVFLDEFAWQIDASGSIEPDTVKGLNDLADILIEREPGDRRSS